MLTALDFVAQVYQQYFYYFNTLFLGVA